MLFLLALRSVRARPRSWIVGLLAVGMAALLSLGLPLVESIYDGTRRSLIESGAGHLQVYNASSPEAPRMMVPTGPPELTPLPDYAATEALVRQVEGVQEVVPLEVGMATVFRGNYLDDKLAAAREVAREPASARRDARLKRIAEDLERTVRGIARDARRREQAFASDADAREDERALEEASSQRFWEGFLAEPLPALEFLENRVAKQVGEGESIILPFLGSDLPRFARAFSRFELVLGEVPPAGQRGILLGHGAYEQNFKLTIATRLDELRRELERGNTLARDERLRTLVARNLVELPDLLARLDVERASALQEALVRHLGHAGEPKALLEEFLSLDDGNFEARYQAFYRELAPHLPLYRLRPGDFLLLKGFLGVGSGVPVRVWGTFRFRGLGGDTSRVNTTSLVDLISVRLLSERPTRAQQEEARRLVESFGLGQAGEELSGESFGRPMIVDAQVAASGGEAPVFGKAMGQPEQAFTQQELEEGLLQAALVLEPGASPEAVAERIGQLSRERDMKLGTVGWRQVGGMISGMVGMTQLLLFVLAALLGLFVLLVSTSTLLLLAQERVGEVGMMRAMGMQRRQVFLGFLWEGLLLGGVGALLGTGLGALVLKGPAGVGLPVRNEALQFFLGGPVLHLRLEPWHVLLVGLVVTMVVVGSALVPAWRGSRVLPIVAMRRGED